MKKNIIKSHKLNLMNFFHIVTIALAIPYFTPPHHWWSPLHWSIPSTCKYALVLLIFKKNKNLS